MGIWALGDWGCVLSYNCLGCLIAVRVVVVWCDNDLWVGLDLFRGLLILFVRALRW